MPVVVGELVGSDQIGAGLGLLYFNGSVGGLIGSPLAGTAIQLSFWFPVTVAQPYRYLFLSL